MIWTIIGIAIGVILIFITSPTSALVGWFLRQFSLHPQLDPKEITVSYNGRYLGEEEKDRFSKYFNEAQFIERHHIFPGTEKSFLQPDTNVIPFVINVTSRNKEMNFIIYPYKDHVDVVKQWKKKVASFSLQSEQLQIFSLKAI
ncbi:YfmQ family protein [Sporosarcina sp. ACRSL]|uniref:YfmQ family protein n=1 Tax=Sporosarcina sp. ACRSL TaxID=2918215 RepID=UPI001EF56920|nr:YfmQ family protein [Sporosarcina sp. ACRSL]MCG7344682.1 YfmQ family protein [Sporosarcina sp. ACRSL]